LLDIEDILYKKDNLATCKIITEDNKGSGFFIIPFDKNKLKVLLTNNHILNRQKILNRY